MSLKTFHVVFIVVAIVLAAWVAAWGLLQGLGAGGGGWEVALGAASALAAVGLVVYLMRFVKKMKGVSYL